MEEPHHEVHTRVAKSIKSMNMNSLSGKDLKAIVKARRAVDPSEKKAQVLRRNALSTLRSRAAKSKRNPSPSHGNSTIRWTRARTKDSKRTTNDSKRGRAEKGAARRMFKEAVAKKKAARVVVFSIRKDGTAGGLSSKRDLPPSPPLEQANNIIDPQRHVGPSTSSTATTAATSNINNNTIPSSSVSSAQPAKNHGAAAGQLGRGSKRSM